MIYANFKIDDDGYIHRDNGAANDGEDVSQTTGGKRIHNTVLASELPAVFQAPDEILEGVFTAGAGSIVYGDSNSGKTFLLIDMACSIARGLKWMGRNTEPGLIIYLATESPSSIISRIQAYQSYHGVIVPNFAIVQNPIDLFSHDSDTNLLIKVIKQVEEETGQTARLIIGDTLARLSAGANENAGQDMSLVVKRFDRIREETKAHFCLIHHCGKNAAAGARGWSGVRAAVDTEIEVTDTADGRCCEITKQRDLGTKGERVGFRLEPIQLGVTKWGAPATSCIVLDADAPIKKASTKNSEIVKSIVSFLKAAPIGTKKTDVVNHLNGKHASSAVYRELKKLIDSKQAIDNEGVISLVPIVPNSA
jgi:putative DNA primase/helicase